MGRGQLQLYNHRICPVTEEYAPPLHNWTPQQTSRTREEFLTASAKVVHLPSTLGDGKKTERGRGPMKTY